MTTLRRNFFLANALITTWLTLQAASPPKIEIRSGQSTTVMPGSFFSATLAVSFQTQTGETWRDRLIVPEGWNAMSPVDLPFTPSSNEEIRLVAVAVPRTATQGSYTIHYVIATESDPTRELARAELTIVIPSVSTFEIKPELAPERAIAGEKIIATWRLSNRGNLPVNIELTARSTLEYMVTLNLSQVQLDPGKSAFVSGEVALPANLRREQNHTLLLDAHVAEDGQTSSQTALINTLVIPRFTTAAESEEGMQLALQTTTVSRKTSAQESSGVQTELIGHGYLDVERAQRLDFLLRPKPITSESSGLLAHEQYTLTYRSKMLDLLLGDNLYTLSPLTQRWLFGRGLGAEYRQSPFTIGSYYADTPWQTIETKQTAAFLQYTPSPALGLRGNFLDQHTSDPSPWAEPHSTLPSVQLFAESAQPDRTTLFETEGALSVNRQHANGEAYRTRLRGRWGPDIFYDFEQLRASPDYFGYYRDMESTNGNLTWQIDPRWRTRASFQETETNLARDPQKSSAPVARNLTAGIDRNLSPQFTTSVDYNLASFSYRLPGERPNFNQETATFATLWTANRVSIRAAVEAGQTRITTAPETTRRFHYISLFVYARPKPSQTYTLYAGTGDSRYNPDAQRQTTIIGATQWTLGEAFHVRGALTYNYNSDGRTPRDKAAELNLGYDFLGGSTVELGFRKAELSNNQQDCTILFRYTVPLHVRILSPKTRGSLEGILQLQTPEGVRPLAGAVLRLDKLQAATDRNGHFVFPSVKAGRYTLVTDATSLGSGNVLDDSRPVVITIEKGKRERLQLNAVRAARLEGHIAVFEPENGKIPSLPTAVVAPPVRLKPTTNLSQILVELRGPNGLLRRTVSDAWGRFTFDRLIPGEWTLQIDEQAIPQWHRLERSEFVLNLEPGESSQIEARVIPVQRPIKMIDDGWISLSTPSKS